MESCEAGQQDRKAAHLLASYTRKAGAFFPSPLPTKEEEEEGYTNQRICFLQPVEEQIDCKELHRDRRHIRLCVSLHLVQYALSILSYRLSLGL